MDREGIDIYTYIYIYIQVGGSLLPITVEKKV